MTEWHFVFLLAWRLKAVVIIRKKKTASANRTETDPCSKQPGCSMQFSPLNGMLTRGIRHYRPSPWTLTFLCGVAGFWKREFRWSLFAVALFFDCDGLRRAELSWYRTYLAMSLCMEPRCNSRWCIAVFHDYDMEGSVLHVSWREMIQFMARLMNGNYFAWTAKELILYSRRLARP